MILINNFRIRYLNKKDCLAFETVLLKILIIENIVYITPCAIIASATFMKPAILAPLT